MKLERAATIDAWAELVTSLLVERLQRTPTLSLCLPTGLTPVPIYDRLAAAIARRDVSLARATIFLLDEFGGVASDDPGRCDSMLRRGLLDRVDLPPAQFHGFDLTGDVERECASFEAAVGGGCDISLLGIGSNGHIGMNEPGSPPDSVTRRVTLAADTVTASARYFNRQHDLPTWGVTMGVGTILRSREIWVLATGAGKAAIVSRTLRGPVTDAIPASLLRTHANTLLFADEDAAAMS
jgi:glucosamine-6-phosphate deaminase